MYKFSEKSLEKLSTCDPRLIAIANKLIDVMDVTVLCGHRNKFDQTQAFINGTSKLNWPHSKHNSLPSRAMDLAPCPIDWNNIARFNEMLDLVNDISLELGIKINLGRNFSFKDYPHIELAEK